MIGKDGERDVQEQRFSLSNPHGEPAARVIAALGSNPVGGLTEADAAGRRIQWGPNRLDTKGPRPVWLRFLGQFTDTLVLLLIAAALVSGGLWLYERDADLPYEAIAILCIVFLNAVMGHVQRSRAEAAAKALRDMTAPQATVMRSGERRSVPAEQLVPGDIILVEEGGMVPADARVLESSALHAAEAALTGESIPVAKHADTVSMDSALGDRGNMLFCGTPVARGHGIAVVTATGMQTEMGRIADMLKQTRDKGTPLQRELDRVGRLLGAIVVAIAALMIGIVFLVTDVTNLTGAFDVFILGVALAVAAVPEGLPAIVTAVLSIGVQRMAARRAIVRHLAAVEALGSATVIASDKTGTLTRNEMSVRRIITASGSIGFDGPGFSPEGHVEPDLSDTSLAALRSEVVRALAAAERANNAALQERDGRWIVQGDPTEGALIVAARRAGLRADALDTRFPRVGEVPFSSERKLMSTVHRDAGRGDKLRAFTKGAPDVLLARCSHELVGEETTRLTNERRKQILQANDGLAGEAMRTLGVAFRSLREEKTHHDTFTDDIEHDLVFLGLVGMIDPPRDEARQAIARARQAGIRTVMITGDHPRTAAVIAGELGISEGGCVLSGVELEKMSQQELDRIIRDVSVFARVDPVHKLRIVEAMRSQGDTVAMTGDGINDAPALKAADIGIAMGITGTDVSKETADIVLADDNFATIVAAVEEGRAIFSNIRKFLRYLLSSNIGEVMTMIFGVLAADLIGLTAGHGHGLILPLLATQILWINLVTDGVPALALGLDPIDPSTMRKAPRPRGERVITRRMWTGIAFVGVIMAVGTLLVMDASLPAGLIKGTGTIDYARTMCFTTLTLFQLFNVFNARSDDRSAFSGLFANRWLWAAIALSLALHAAVVYLPFLQRAFSTVSLNGADWFICAATASSVVWLRELSKLLTPTQHSRST
jgi:Ca2+-transporting ATPase